MLSAAKVKGKGRRRLVADTLVQFCLLLERMSNV